MGVGRRCGCCGRGKAVGAWLCAVLLLLLCRQVAPSAQRAATVPGKVAQFYALTQGCVRSLRGSPTDTVSLHLERNFIRTIPESAFSDLPHLQDLYLSHNRIESLSPGALRHLSTDLKLLDLSHNLLRRVSREDFGSTRAKTRLYHNPWHCDCNLQELVETLNLEPETVNGIVCESSARVGGEGGRWEELGGAGEHVGQPLVKLLDAGVNFCSLQRKTTDVAMLVTMFAWFFMVIVYVVYYVRQNQAEARRHLEYLKSLPSPRKMPVETDTLSTGI